MLPKRGVGGAVVAAAAVVLPQVGRVAPEHAPRGRQQQGETMLGQWLLRPKTKKKKTTCALPLPRRQVGDVHGGQDECELLGGGEGGWANNNKK